MQCVLKSLLEPVGMVSHKSLPFPRLEDIDKREQAPAVAEVYHKLGGVLSSPRLNLRPWDMEFDGVAVELDERLHFNRYRALTLDSPVYTQLSTFPLNLYREYCSAFEVCCLKAGGYGGKW